MRRRKEKEMGVGGGGRREGGGGKEGREKEREEQVTEEAEDHKITMLFSRESLLFQALSSVVSCVNIVQFMSMQLCIL